MFFNEISNEDFLKQISLSSVTHYFNIEDIILYHGDMSRNLYCVKKGYIEVKREGERNYEKRYMYMYIHVILKFF